MDENILKLLRSSDAAQRKKAIIAAGKSRDAAYLKPLTQVFYTDSEQALRDLAQKAVAHIRSSTTEPEAEVKTSASLSTAPGKSTQTVKVIQPTRARRYSFTRVLLLLLFFALTLGAAGAFVWVQRGDQIRYQLYLNQLNTQLDAPRELPIGETAWGDLSGSVYETQISDTTLYYIQEPSGTMPEGGWSVVACIHGTNGSGQNCLNWMGDGRAYYEGVIFVAPTFSGDGQGYQYDKAAGDMRVILSQIEAYYRINWSHSVIYGFSGGGMFASIYTANYPLDFAGAVLGNAPEYQLPPTNTAVKYAVITGETDGNLQFASSYVTEMERRGTAVWSSLMLENVGHTVTLDHVDLS